MQLLCLGDLALTDQPLSCKPWTAPGALTPNPVQIIFNWEFPIGDTVNSKPRASGLRFIAHPDSVDVIKSWAPGFATLANNHILDAGEDGLAQTIYTLQQMGFKTVGAGLTFDEVKRPLLWETAEGRLAIINWVFAETHPDWLAIPGPNCWPGSDSARLIIQDLKRETDWVMVVVHWSDELFPYPMPKDRQIAHELAGMGADIVIGHHPHVVRGMELVGACPVFYSLGNFYFAEKRNSNGNWILQEAPRNREGLGVQFTFRRGQNLEYKLLSFWNNKQEAMPDPFQRASRRMKTVSSALHRYQGDTYVSWYKKERARFDQWESRWHFGLLRRGVIGSLQRLILKIQKYFRLSR